MNNRKHDDGWLPVWFAFALVLATTGCQWKIDLNVFNASDSEIQCRTEDAVVRIMPNEETKVSGAVGKALLDLPIVIEKDRRALTFRISEFPKGHIVGGPGRMTLHLVFTEADELMVASHRKGEHTTPVVPQPAGFPLKREL